jgi:hypothetical protein
MFYALAENNANSLIGVANDPRNSPEWAGTCRALDHGRARSQAIPSAINRFPATIIGFAETFVYLQELRHDADYNPLSVFTRSETGAAISRAEAAVERFIATANRNRRSFAAQGCSLPDVNRTVPVTAILIGMGDNANEGGAVAPPLFLGPRVPEGYTATASS